MAIAAKTTATGSATAGTAANRATQHREADQSPTVAVRQRVHRYQQQEPGQGHIVSPFATRRHRPVEQERADPGGDRGHPDPTSLWAPGQDHGPGNDEGERGQGVDRLAEYPGPDQLTISGCAHRVNVRPAPTRRVRFSAGGYVTPTMSTLPAGAEPKAGARPNSLWMADPDWPRFGQLQSDLTVQALVVGSGITGLTAARLLADEGMSVAVVDSSRLCSGVTGFTTAKLTALQSTIYTDLVHTWGEEVAAGYAVGEPRFDRTAFADGWRTRRSTVISRPDPHTPTQSPKSTSATSKLRSNRLDAPASMSSSPPRPTFPTRSRERCASTARRSSTHGDIAAASLRR